MLAQHYPGAVIDEELVYEHEYGWVVPCKGRSDGHEPVLFAYLFYRDRGAAAAFGPRLSIKCNPES